MKAPFTLIDCLDGNVGMVLGMQVPPKHKQLLFSSLAKIYVREISLFNQQMAGGTRFGSLEARLYFPRPVEVGKLCWIIKIDRSAGVVVLPRSRRGGILCWKVLISGTVRDAWVVALH